MSRWRHSFLPTISMFQSDPSTALSLFDHVGGAQECRALAEEWFKQNHFEAAITAIVASSLKNPLQFSTPNLGYFYAYMAHFYNQSFYATLGIPYCDPSVEEIKKKYKETMMMVHPDKCPSVAATSAMKLLNEAWEVLSDPAKRSAHDCHLISVGRYLHHSTLQTALPKRTNNTY